MREYYQLSAARAVAALAPTSIARQTSALLDFAHDTKSMVLIEGESGIGKTETAKQWCAARPGLARFVEIPSSNDDRSFYAAFAEAVGVAHGLSMTGQQINDRVKAALKESRLTLVCDESQYLWPQYMRPRGTPDRVLWIESLFDAGCAIAMVAMPDFSKWHRVLKERSNWTDAQFMRRVSRYLAPPPQLAEEDLMILAKHMMPSGNAACHKLLTGHGLFSKGNGGAIAEALKTARYNAGKDGRAEATLADLKSAIVGECLPSELAHAAAVSAKPSQGIREASARSARRGRATRLQTLSVPSDSTPDFPARETTPVADTNANRLNADARLVLED